MGPSTPPAPSCCRMLGELDCELSAQWYGRDTPNQVEADRLSKLIDNSDFVLEPAARQRVLEHPLLQGRQPTVDPFGSSASSMAPCFYSKVGCPGSSGIDGMKRSWAVAGPEGERPLVWVYPDFGCMGAVVEKLLYERQDAVLIYPDWSRSWRATMMVPERLTDFMLGRVTEVSRPTSRVAQGLQQAWQQAGQAAQHGRHAGPAYKLRCALFSFGCE